MKPSPSSILTKIVVLALIAYAAAMLAGARGRIAAAEADEAVLEARADALLRENLSLEYELAHAGDPELIAELARARLGLVRPGEKVFIAD